MKNFKTKRGMEVKYGSHKAIVLESSINSVLIKVIVDGKVIEKRVSYSEIKEV